MGIYTTEITSDTILSDNPLHQRLLKAYTVAKPYIKGNLLELGCGEGRGVKELAPLASHYTALDKIGSVIDQLSAAYPGYTFRQASFPPINEDGQYDTIVSFQVIEHIRKDLYFLQEIHRLLKPGGVAILSTPNKKMSLSRNPWHIREYTWQELQMLAAKVFDKVDMKGIAGSEKVMQYHEENRKSVQRIMRYDILNLQHRLPAWLLRLPYEILNRRNRNQLEKGDPGLISTISQEDYFLREASDLNLDLYCFLYK